MNPLTHSDTIIAEELCCVQDPHSELSQETLNTFLRTLCFYLCDYCKSVSENIICNHSETLADIGSTVCVILTFLCERKCVDSSWCEYENELIYSDSLWLVAYSTESTCQQTSTVIIGDIFFSFLHSTNKYKREQYPQ